MHKITNFTGSRLERMPFGMSRPQVLDLSASQPPVRRPHGAPPVTPPSSADSNATLSFNVPFSSNLPGPEVDEILHSSPGAIQRWVWPIDTPEGTPIHKLPVHSNNVEGLRRLCRQISDSSAGRIEALVTSSEPKAAQALQRRPQGQVTNVCISGDGDLVHKMRAKILNETPILLVHIPSTASTMLPLTGPVEIGHSRYRSKSHCRRSERWHPDQRSEPHQLDCKLHWNRYIPSQP